MKCQNCGANIKREQTTCPYCGSLNHTAVKEKQVLQGMQNDNQDFKKQVLKENAPMLHYKIHKRVNIALLCLFLLVTLISMLTFFAKEERWGMEKGSMEKCRALYEEGRYQELYRYMSDYDMFDPETNFEYGQMALLWGMYEDCQDRFALTYEEYKQKGAYDKSYLEWCVRSGYDVLTVNLSYTYNNLTERNREKFAPYQEQIYLLFTGVLQIPEEMLEGQREGTYDYWKEKELMEYVVEVLPNEE